MLDLESRKADRAERENRRKDQLREEGANEEFIERGSATTLADAQSENADNANQVEFNSDTASFMELKGYAEEREGEGSVKPGTSTDTLRAHVKELEAKAKENLQGNGSGGSSPWQS